ncbi:MAG: protein kinase [Rhabdochlamydiaceae bacterium]|nr:protein kinase [Rhabdochlamydiaceae bacterium]
MSAIPGNQTEKNWASALDRNRIKNDSEILDLFEKLNFQVKFEASCKAAKQQGVGQLMRRKVHSLKRSIYVAPNNEIYILFNTRDDRLIAHGGQKKVKLALNVKTGKLCAYKVTRNVHDPKEKKALIKEYHLGLSLSGSSFCKPIEGTLRVEEDRIAYLEEYMPFGDLTCLMDQPIEQNVISSLALQMAETCAALHEQGYVSRDIKPANYFIERIDHGIPKIRLGDFGEAVALRKQSSKKQEPMWTYGFVAPEYIRAARTERSQRNAPVAEGTTEKLDSWALGMSLLSVFNRNLHGFIQSNPALSAFIHSDDQNGFTEELFNDSSWIQQPENKNTLEYVIYKLLIVDPAKRWTPRRAADYLASIELEFPSTSVETFQEPDLETERSYDDSYPIAFDLDELTKAALQFETLIQTAS